MDNFRVTECDQFVHLGESVSLLIATIRESAKDSSSRMCIYRAGNLCTVGLSGVTLAPPSIAKWFTSTSDEKPNSDQSIFRLDTSTLKSLSPAAKRCETVLGVSSSGDWMAAWALELDQSEPLASAKLLMTLPSYYLSFSAALEGPFRAACIDPKFSVKPNPEYFGIEETEDIPRVMVLNEGTGWTPWPVPVELIDFTPVSVKLSGNGQAIVGVFEKELVSVIVISSLGVVWKGKRVDKGSLFISLDGSHVIWRGVCADSPFTYAFHSRVFLYSHTAGVRCLSEAGSLVIGSGFLDASTGLWFTVQNGVSTLSSVSFIDEKFEELVPPITSRAATRNFYTTESLDMYPHLYIKSEDRCVALPTSIGAQSFGAREWKHDSLPNLRGVMYEKISESRPRRDIAIYLHGGPAMEVSAFRKSVDYFDPILSQGLCVLCISYAGSLGFGDEYAQEVIGVQGRRDLCDVEETIKAFSGRIACVFGGSYGGFLSLHAFCKIPLNHVPCFAALYPYVSSRGCASESGDFAWEREYTGSKTMNEWPIPKMCLDPDVVPLLYSADVVEKPLLLLHGDKDDVCPLSQSQVVFHILRQRGNDKVELVKFAGEGHGFKKSVKKISMEKISNFIKKHCDKV